MASNRLILAMFPRTEVTFCDIEGKVYKTINVIQTENKEEASRMLVILGNYTSSSFSFSKGDPIGMYIIFVSKKYL